MNNRNIPPYTPPHLSRDNTLGDPKGTPQSTPLVTTHRLSPDAYKALERQLDDSRVTGTTTEGQAFFKLGIQHTLKLLRDGFVTGA